MAILTTQEAADMLGLDDPANYPKLNVILPAVDDFIKNATGKDWAADTVIDPVSKIAATVLLVRWFEDPGMIGKADDLGIIGLIKQLAAKALQEVVSA